MAREDPHFRLRLPSDLKQSIERAAANNKRSITAEIVARLESFDGLQQKASGLEKTALKLQEIVLKQENDHNAYKVEITSHMNANEKAYTELRNGLKAGIPQNQTLYVALDAKGSSTTWSEINSRLSEIIEVGKFEVNAIDARIFDAKLAFSDLREQNWAKLLIQLRKAKREK